MLVNPPALVLLMLAEILHPLGLTAVNRRLAMMQLIHLNV